MMKVPQIRLNYDHIAFVPPDGCDDSEYECSNSRCIPTDYLCDGVFDCADGSDELQLSCSKYM